MDKYKIFITYRGEIIDRLDPVMVAYNSKVQNYKFPVKPLNVFLKKKPQYGANEPGIERYDESTPRYIRITDIDNQGNLSDDLGMTTEVIESQYFLNNNDLLFARSGNTVGKSYLHKDSNTPYDCFFAGYMIRYVIDEKKNKS